MGIITDWRLYQLKSGDIHVIPVDDLGEHTFRDCKCNPELEIEEDLSEVWVHNSFDGREAFERGERKPS